MLAIIIPFYNIYYFEETLISLAHQVNKKFNVYIGNDGSKNDPIELIEFYGKTLNINYKKFNNNIGGTSLPQHWERCIEMVNDEEWLMILGDDDLLDSYVVEKWYNQRNIFEDQCNVVRFSSQIINSAGIPSGEIFTHPVWEKSSDSFLRKINNLTRSSLSEHIFRKSMYNKYRFRKYKLGWFSDDMAWLDFSEDKPIYSINETLVQVRVSEMSISGKSDNKEEKRAAANQFFKTIIREKINIFVPYHRLEILRNYEILVKRTKFNYRSWIFFFLQYLKHGSSKDVKFYLKRSLK